MASPRISVIMPVYNTAAFLEEAIKSIIQQTFKDFELIIINDGSTDISEVIISSFNDNRIRYYKNDKNEGLVYTLNRGIDLASAEWIARMDGDDISLPLRFEKQWDYVISHAEVQVLATTVMLINEQGQKQGIWKDDVLAISPTEIRSYLPKNNCIAHPTVFIRTELLRKYRYNILQPQSEDYDLWLRLTSDAISINKLKEPLLLHRILSSSFTRSSKMNSFQKLALTKYQFARAAMKSGEGNLFVYRTLFNSCLDAIKGQLKNMVGK